MSSCSLLQGHPLMRLQGAVTGQKLTFCIKNLYNTFTFPFFCMAVEKTPEAISQPLRFKIDDYADSLDYSRSPCRMVRKEEKEYSERDCLHLTLNTQDFPCGIESILLEFDKYGATYVRPFIRRIGRKDDGTWEKLMINASLYEMGLGQAQYPGLKVTCVNIIPAHESSKAIPRSTPMSVADVPTPSQDQALDTKVSALTIEEQALLKELLQKMNQSSIRE